MTHVETRPHAVEDETIARRRKDVTYWVDERRGRFPWPWWKMLPVVLIVGAASIAIMTFVMLTVYERQVIAEAKDDLRAAGIEPRGFTFDADYRDLTITGQAQPDTDLGAQTEAIRAAVLSGDGVRNLDIDLREAPVPVAEPVDEPEPEPQPEPEPEPEPAAPITGPTEVSVAISEGAITLIGEVLSEAQRETLVAAAEARFGPANVVDELIVTGNEPATDGADERVADLATVIGAIPEGGTGTANLSDTALDIEMSVADQDAADSLQGEIDQITGLDVAATIDVRETPVEAEIDALQAEFEALSAEIRENVTFATSSDVLNDSATVTLDKVVALLDQYQLPVVEISGHTDARGDDAANLALSDARAAAVASYLIDSGVDAERIRSVGKGETEPIASNDTAEGQAENRRVKLEALATF